MGFSEDTPQHQLEKVRLSAEAPPEVYGCGAAEDLLAAALGLG